MTGVDVATGLIDPPLRSKFTAFHEQDPTDFGVTVPREYWVTVGVRG